MASIWLDNANPHKLPAPPQWWQDAVYDYDADLRIMPSAKNRVYRLCRVVRREARLGLKAALVHDHPDTRAMIRHYVVPVASIDRFHPQIVAELRSRDLWLKENRDATDQLEAAEATAEQRAQRRQDDELAQIAGDAFRQVQYAKGERISLRDLQRGRTGPTATPNRVTMGGGVTTGSRKPVPRRQIVGA